MRAQYRWLVAGAVRRVRPLLTDHLSWSGSWFPSRFGFTVVPSKVSTPVSGVTWRGGERQDGAGIRRFPGTAYELDDGPAAPGLIGGPRPRGTGAGVAWCG